MKGDNLKRTAAVAIDAVKTTWGTLRGDSESVQRFNNSARAYGNAVAGPGVRVGQTATALSHPIKTADELSRELSEDEIRQEIAAAVGPTAAAAFMLEGVGAPEAGASETLAVPTRAAKTRTGRPNPIPEQGPFVVTERGVAMSTQGVVGRVTPPNARFGTTVFGNQIQQPVADLVETLHPDVAFQFRIEVGQTGVDVQVLRGDPGFDFADIKPRSASGRKKFNKQVEQWGLPIDRTIAITYDADGNIRYEWGK